MSLDEKSHLEEEEQDEVDLDAHFEFFLELAKPLALQLPSGEDKTLAAAWITRLNVTPETDEEKRLRVDYLKLLLFVMQRGRLIGIFRGEPPEETLEPFPQGFGLTEMGNYLLEQAELQDRGDASTTGVCYSVEISNDLKEFVAAQEIPDFGVQVYYAWSTEEPIHKWSSFDEKKFPQYVRDKIRQLKVLNSEEKTNVQTTSYADSPQRKPCPSSIYYKSKAKVKSPQEIEGTLERNCRLLGNVPPQEECPKEDDKECICGKKSRSANKKCPSGIPRRMDPEDSEEGGQNDLDTSAGGMRSRGQAECDCRQSKQDPESSKRIHSGSKNSNTKGGDMFADNERCVKENLNKGKPLCPAAELYLLNQAKQMKKKKCSPQGNMSQQQSSLQSKSGSCTKSPPVKTCSAPPSARPPCTCSCPREESPSSKKKSPSEKSWCTTTPETSVESSQCQSSPDEADEGQYQQGIMNNLHHLDGCNCLEGAPTPKQLEGLERLGFPKTTPDPCIKDIKQSRPLDKTYTIEQKKSQEKPKNISVPCPPQISPPDDIQSPSFKSRTRIVGEQKASTCPPPRTKPPNMNEGCPGPYKSTTLDNYGPPQPSRPGCAGKFQTGDSAPCPPQPFCERQFQNKKYHECPGEEDEDEDVSACGAGYSSSSDNIYTSGSPCADEHSSEWPKSTEEEGFQSQCPGAQQPFFLNQQGPQFPMGCAGGNAPFSAPPNSPNYKQPGQYPTCFGGGNQFSQATYNQSDNQGSCYSSSQSPSGSYGPIDQATYTQTQQCPTYTVPASQAFSKSCCPSQMNYRTPPGRQIPQSGHCSAPPPQPPPQPRQGMETRPGRMHVDPRDFPQNATQNCPVMPTFSTPWNTAAPPAPPKFLLSPITNSPEAQWVRLGGGSFCPRSPRANDRCPRDRDEPSNPEWVSLRSEQQSKMGRPCNRTTDQSSEMQGEFDPDSLMRFEPENTSMACHYGSYNESPKWTELPKSTRFPKKNPNRSTCI